MFKKFFVAVILGLLVMSSQIVSAADIDWNSAPRINSKAQLATYIENGRRKGQTEFYFVFPSAKISNQAEFDDFNFELAQYIAPAPNIHLNLVRYGTGRFICKITKDFPGNHVANAYLSSNQQQSWMDLTNEEKKLYNIAVGIVDEANKYTSEREKAWYIHKVICDRVLEYKVGNERNENAIGALIDRYAQCQGYSDTFYMLGRMCGLNVGRIRGHINKDNGLHIWNTITFNDGKTYFVDVTNDDLSNTDIFFCATKETMQKYVSCEWEIIPNLQ